jgi:hypothetical protein
MELEGTESESAKVLTLDSENVMDLGIEDPSVVSEWVAIS